MNAWRSCVESCKLKASVNNHVPKSFAGSSILAAVINQDLARNLLNFSNTFPLWEWHPRFATCNLQLANARIKLKSRFFFLKLKLLSWKTHWVFSELLLMKVLKMLISERKTNSCQKSDTKNHVNVRCSKRVSSKMMNVVTMKNLQPFISLLVSKGSKGYDETGVTATATQF